ncbi:flagellar motor protein MotB [Methylobacterium brachythecii]|nr:flagellar motor protein MotB [Methylobacterium brachythecii]
MGAPVRADPAYKASDIVAHFSPTKALGGSRSLCIGTETECAKAIPEQSKPVDGFDLKVNFDYNSDRLTSAARSNLDEFARALKDPNLSASHFLVEGHTDGMGSDAFNLDLSMRRAAAVVKYLTVHGVGDDRLEAKGYGKQKPLVSDLMSSENRRVETRLRNQ